MKKRIAGLLVMGLLLGGTAGTLRAENQWQANHPARTKDNKRIKKQKNQARQDYKNGTISKQQEKADLKTDNAIGAQERQDAHSNDNGGHLDGAQQQQINSELNAQHQQLNAQGQ